MGVQLHDGRRSFYQWDTNQQLDIIDNGVCNEIHFCNQKSQQTLTCKVKEQDGRLVVDVPNSLLHDAGIIYAYGFMRNEDSSETRFTQRFSVVPRPRPADYVYTETEIQTYRDLDKRVEKLEAGGSFDAAAQMAALIETDMLPAVHNADGKILTDETGRVILRY